MELDYTKYRGFHNPGQCLQCYCVSVQETGALLSVVSISGTLDESPLNKLYKIAPIVNEPRTHHLNTRRDQSVFNRCRIGHSRLTQEFLLKGELPPECIPCNCPLTIKHLLIDCVDFRDVRQRFYRVPSL